MKIDDLMQMKVADLLDQFCVVYSPECGYNYGIARWEDAELMYEEFDLEDEYCFSGDSLIPLDYGFDCGEDILEADDLRRIMNVLGMVKKEFCPECDSHNYHFDYNKMCMVCGDCKYEGEPHYYEIKEEEKQ